MVSKYINKDGAYNDTIETKISRNITHIDACRFNSWILFNGEGRRDMCLHLHIFKGTNHHVFHIKPLLACSQNWGFFWYKIWWQFKPRCFASDIYILCAWKWIFLATLTYCPFKLEFCMYSMWPLYQHCTILATIWTFI